MFFFFCLFFKKIRKIRVFKKITSSDYFNYDLHKNKLIYLKFDLIKKKKIKDEKLKSLLKWHRPFLEKQDTYSFVFNGEKSPWSKLIKKEPHMGITLTQFFKKNFKKNFLKNFINYINKEYTFFRKKEVVFFKKNINILNIKRNKLNLIFEKFSNFSLKKNYSNTKHLNIFKLKKFNLQFIRRNKVFNKGRYSRTRQNYRTGVYMCMYLSVTTIFGTYFFFFGFTFKFSFLWWFFVFFLFSFFSPKIIKYRLYNPINIIKNFYYTYKWLLSFFFKF